jgi:hypothetical protein
MKNVRVFINEAEQQIQGERVSLTDAEMLSLIKKVDNAYHSIYDKPTFRFKLKIWNPIYPLIVPLFVLLFIMTIVDQFFIPTTTVDKVNIGINISALAVALGALAISLVQVFFRKMGETEEDQLFSISKTDVDGSLYPLLKGLIRMRVRSRTSDLKDLYKLESALFDPKAVLRELIQ